MLNRWKQLTVFIVSPFFEVNKTQQWLWIHLEFFCAFFGDDSPTLSVHCLDGFCIDVKSWLYCSEKSSNIRLQNFKDAAYDPLRENGTTFHVKIFREYPRNCTYCVAFKVFYLLSLMILSHSIDIGEVNLRDNKGSRFLVCNSLISSQRSQIHI